MKSSPLIWGYVVNVKSMVKIFQIFVAFLENMSFKIMYILTHIRLFASKIYKQVVTFDYISDLN